MNTIEDLEKAVIAALEITSTTKHIAEKLKEIFEREDEEYKGTISSHSESDDFKLFCNLEFIGDRIPEKSIFWKQLRYKLSLKAREFYNDLKASGYYETKNHNTGESR